MADKELQSVLNGGTITQILIGGTTTGDKVLTKDEIDAGYALSSGLTVMPVVKYAPQVTAPTPVEGQVFYDDNEKALTLQTDIANFSHNLGQELVTRVINKTGSTILNGQVCYQPGTDITTGRPTIALAQADAFETSHNLGLATTDILNNEEGFVTVSGKVNGLDTSSFTAGQELYLSDTTPGAIVGTPPVIASRVASALIIDATVGNVLVGLEDHQVFQTAIGFMQGQVPASKTYITSVTPLNIDDYSTQASELMTTDDITGGITLFSTGIHEASLTCRFEFASSTSTRQMEFNIVNSRTGNEFTYTKNIPRDATSATLSFTIPFSGGIAADIITATVASADDITITMEAVSFSVKSINAR